MKKYLIYCYALLAISCNSHYNEAINEPETVNYKYKINLDKITDTLLFLNDKFSFKRLIPLESSVKPLIGDISQLLIHNDTIFILDVKYAKSIFCFDKNGKFIKRIGSIGKGPGEYIKPMCITENYKKNELLILDLYSKKILVYKTNGAYSRTINLVSRNCTSMGSEGNYYYTDMIKEREHMNDCLIQTYNTEGVMIEKHLSPKINNYYYLALNAGKSKFLSTHEDVKFIDQFMYEIFSLKDGKVFPYIKLNTQYKYNREELQILQEEYTKTKNVLTFLNSKGKCWGFGNYKENDNYIFFKYSNYYGVDNNIILFNKNTEKIQNIKHLAESNFASLNSSIKILYFWDDYMIASLYPNTGRNIPENYKKDSIDLDSESIQIFNNYKEEKDNPILVIYETK